MIILFLTLSIICSTIRNVCSKELSGLEFGEKTFFLAQAVIFLSGSLFLCLTSGSLFKSISYETLYYSLIYGILLITAQYCYTIALKSGNVGICSIIYSLGFIFPTLSGALFWGEDLSLYNITGILIVIPVIIISGLKPSNKNKSSKSISFIAPLILAMVASGGLGIMQKVQQTSSYAEEKPIFLVAAFAFSGIVSLIFSVFNHAEKENTLKSRRFFYASCTGIAFGLTNTLNTTLAGMLDSAILFPTLSIGTILFSMILGIIIFKDKISAKDISVLALAVLSITLITVF